MASRWALPLLLLLAACPKHTVPDHLQLSPEQASTVVIDSAGSAMAALLAGDPLARSQPSLDPQEVRPWDPSLADWLVRSSVTTEDDLLEPDEARWRGTAILALARARRLAVAERL